MGIRNFRDLKVRRHGKEPVIPVYKTTSTFPRDEVYGITSRMRRASISIPVNIAEGFNRHHSGDYGRFPTFALGSCAKLDMLTELAFERGYIDNDQHDKLYELLDHEGRMLRNLFQSITKAGPRAPE